MTSELQKTLMKRDGLTFEESDEIIKDAQRRVLYDNEDPEDILHDEFGLEPDYIFDLLNF